jgi:putative ABC transport system ATP-binding protein
MKYAAEVQDIHKYYDLGAAVTEAPGGSKKELQFAPMGADEGRIIVRALRGVTLRFPVGDFVAIMGSSGSGKSTLLNLLGGLDRPTLGNYILGGLDVSKMSDSDLSQVRNQKIGFIFQSYNLIPQFTVLENIELPMHYRAGYPQISPADSKRCLDLAVKVGLGDRLDHRPFQLSGGQQQRVAIARALVNDPEIILADEPTGNLDSATSAEIMDMLIALNKEGRTIIMVTHEPDIAEHANRQIVMRDGLVFKDTQTHRPATVGAGESASSHA